MIELYFSETCPYCKKVLGFLDANAVDYVKRNIKDYDTRVTLVKLGGKEQVPFLYIKEDSIKMYESDAIINFVRKYIRDCNKSHIKKEPS